MLADSVKCERRAPILQLLAEINCTERTTTEFGDATELVVDEV